METKKVLSRENVATEELQETVFKNYKGIELTYTEVYYLDYEVNEDTGIINKEKKVKHYTKNQVNRNLQALKSAYLVAKGAAAPYEIIKFRNRYHIAASTLSVVLGFSKNTISNIENYGVTSLPSGRLIKMCINNTGIMNQYVELCDFIDKNKKDELFRKFQKHD